MGTRSVVATPLSPVAWRGRYIHWDGYPTGVGEQLQAIVLRDGLAKAVQTLTVDHYGWSDLTHDRPEDHRLERGYDDGRFVSVPGYGTAYTTEAGQSRAEDWVRSDSTEDSGTKYAYVLGESGITVYERTHPTGEHMTGAFGIGSPEATWVEIGLVRYDDEAGMANVG